MNLTETFLTRAGTRPDAIALITPEGRTVSYGDLARGSAARAQAMRKAQIGPGDVVLIALGVSPALYETLLGVFRLGAVAMFPEPAAGLDGIRHAIAATHPKAMVAGLSLRLLRMVVPALRRLPIVPEPDGTPAGDGPITTLPGDAPALITFTSGSTGRPKGIVRSADFLMLQHRLLEEIRQTRPDDVDLISLPVFILSNLAAGATSVIPPGRLTRPASLDGGRLRAQITAHEVNRVAAPPVVCARLAESSGSPITSLAAIFTGGGPVFPNLLRDLERTAPQADIHAVYGSTEAEPIAHVAHADIRETDFDDMASGHGLLAGKPIAQIETELIDNELWVAGPHVNEGYLDPADDVTTKRQRDGKLWHRTGDAARFDAEGRLWLLGRSAAANEGIYPLAYEAAALSWPGVRQAALLAEAGRVRLAVAGDGLDMADLARRAARLGSTELVKLPAIPMDVRHNSKVDYTRLKKIMR